MWQCASIRPGMIHCPPASITSTVLRSSSSTSGGSAPTLLIRSPSMTMASLRAAGRPEPSISDPCAVADHQGLLARGTHADPPCRLSDDGRSLQTGRLLNRNRLVTQASPLGERPGVVSSNRIGLIFPAGEE